MSKWLAYCAIALLFLAILAVGLPKLFGVRPFAVLSGSMTPAIGVGDLVFTQPTAFDDIHEGDVITFVLNDNLDVATHRVVAIDRDQQLITTKGDANSAVDGNPVWYPNVVGVVKFDIPKLGYALNWFSVMSNKIIAITAVVAAFIVALIVDMLRRPARRRAVEGPASSDDSTSGRRGDAR